MTDNCEVYIVRLNQKLRTVYIAFQGPDDSSFTTQSSLVFGAMVCVSLRSAVL